MPFLPVGMYARRDNKKIVWACHCTCHEGEARPDAEEAMLCSSCADEAFTPWTAVLSSLSR